jgi:Fe-S oxidoreductase
MPLQPFNFSKEFNVAACDFCGLCFNKCPVLNLPLDVAQREIKSLIQSGKSKYVLQNCTSCMACNHYCPNNCNPHTLILSKWNERYLHEGLPNRSRLVLPYHFPNLFTIIMKKLPKDEKVLVEQWYNNWKNPQNEKTMLYTGCNTLLQPFLLKSKIFSDIPIFGAPELCCGEPLYRMGCIDAARTVATYLHDEFQQIGFKKLLMPCLAGYHGFKEAYEKVFGVKFNFEVVSIIDWFWDIIQQNELEITPLNKTAVIHDSCWSKASGEHFFNRVRDILALLGVQVLEPEHTKENALCCGIGAAAARYDILYVFKSARKRLKELGRMKPDIIVDYCGGCNWCLSVANKFNFSRLPIYHLIELFQQGIGEKPLHRTDLRARSILMNSFLELLPKGLLSFKRFKINSILDRKV